MFYNKQVLIFVFNHSILQMLHIRIIAFS